MRVLVACEFSGIVRDAFRARGHDAWSCDLLPTDAPGLHYEGDVTRLLDGWVPVRYTADCDPGGDGWCQLADCDPADCKCVGPTQDGVEYLEDGGELFGRPANAPRWDMMIAFPPCTHLALSGARHFAKKRADGRQKAAVDFFMLLANAPVERIAIENPMNIMSTVWRKPDQTIQPYYFGDEYQKTTWLWLKNLPQLYHTPAPTMFENKTHVGRGEMVTFKSGKRHPKWYSELSGDGHTRAKTFQGIADAMAAQWG